MLPQKIFIWRKQFRKIQLFTLKASYPLKSDLRNIISLFQLFHETNSEI